MLNACTENNGRNAFTWLPPQKLLEFPMGSLPNALLLASESVTKEMGRMQTIQLYHMKAKREFYRFR